MISYSPKIYAKVLFSLFQEGKLDLRVLKNFLKILLKNNALRFLPKIFSEFERYYKENLQITEVTIFTPQKLDPESIGFLKEGIEKKYKNKKVFFKEVIDENLIGGFKIQIDDEFLDATFRRFISQLERSLLK